jgi:hypothetical protein
VLKINFKIAQKCSEEIIKLAGEHFNYGQIDQNPGLHPVLELKFLRFI